MGKDESNIVKLSNQSISERVRHLWVDNSGFPEEKLSPEFVDNIAEPSYIRTLRFTDMGEDPDVESLVKKCLGKFKKLRVLDLEGSTYEVVPRMIGTLKHLKILNLRGNSKVKKLPNSICKLQCSKTLRFSNSGIQNLTFLHTLIITSCKNLISLPRGLKYLISLKVLIVFSCEKLDLNMTLGRGNEEDNQDDFVGSGLSLQSLLIKQLPRLETVPQRLLVRSANTLQTLFLLECENLTTLSEAMNFTSLKWLRIWNSPKLSSLQLQMPCLKSFALKGCPILSERFNPESGEDWANIAHVSRIWIDDIKQTMLTLELKEVDYGVYARLT